MSVHIMYCSAILLGCALHADLVKEAACVDVHWECSYLAEGRVILIRLQHI